MSHTKKSGVDHIDDSQWAQSHKFGISNSIIVNDMCLARDELIAIVEGYR
jgi:hypothetical protein